MYNRPMRWLIVALLSVAGLSASVAQEEPAAPGIDRIEAFTDGVVADRMDDLDPAAMMVTVVRGDEQFAKAYGLADAEEGTRATERTLFRIGSISKTFVWLSVMMLAEEGKIDLDADVNDYLTAFTLPEAFGKPVTMHHLMTHRAGFEDTLHPFFDARRDVGFAESLKRSMPERVAPPGERTAYSNWGTSLAALIVENVSGQKFEDFARARILQPLGMTSTTFRDPAELAGRPLNPPALDARMAHPHRPGPGRPEKIKYMAVEPDFAIGAMAMDARDAAKYMRMLLNGTRYDGGQLLSEEAWAKYRQRVFDDRAGADDINHGFMEAMFGNQLAFGHSGTTQFQSIMYVMPESDLGIFASSSSPKADTHPGRIAAMVALYALGQRADISPFLKPGDRALSKELAGTYRSNRMNFSRTEKLLSLGQELTIGVSEDGAAVGTAGDGKKHRYVPIGDDIWISASGAHFKAYRDADGQIFRISGGAGTQTMDKVGPFETTDTLMTAIAIAVLFSVTTLLGAWWRWGREVKSTTLGRKLRAVPFTVAIVWLVLGACMIWAVASLSSMTVEQLQGPGDYPPAVLTTIWWVALIAAIAAAVQILSVVPVWAKSGWTIWRRVHFTLYAAALAFAVFMMWQWNLIGRPFYDVG